MDTKKSNAILKKVKKVPRKNKPGHGHVKFSNIAKTHPDIAKIVSPFWRKVFSLGTLSIDELHNGYIDITMELHEALRDATKKFWKNKNKQTENVKYNIKLSKIQRQLRMLNFLKNRLGMLDHMEFLKARSMTYKQQVPFDIVKEFLARRTPSPGDGTLQNSVVGKNTERRKVREERRIAKYTEPHHRRFGFGEKDSVDNLNEMLENMSLNANSQTTRDREHDTAAVGAANQPYMSELIGASSRVNHSTVAWYPGAKGIVLADDSIKEVDGKIYSDNLPIPKSLVVFQDGVWWHKAKKSWLTRVAEHGRNFVKDSVGYIMGDGSIHIETLEDYQNFIHHFNAPPTTLQDIKAEFAKLGITNKHVWKAKSLSNLLDLVSRKNKKFAKTLETKLTDEVVRDANSIHDIIKFVTIVEIPTISSLFVGLTETFAKQIVRDAKSVDNIITLMASLDNFVPGNKIHRNRFYSEHYKAKIVNLSIEEMFPEIFHNQDISDSQKQMVMDKIAMAKKKIMVFLETGKTTKQYAKPTIKLPIQDISSNPNAFWYIDIHNNLSVGIIGDETLKIHPNSLALADCLLETTITVSQDNEQHYSLPPKENLLANNLLYLLERDLSTNMNAEQMEQENQQPDKLDRLKQQVKEFYSKNPDILNKE